MRSLFIVCALALLGSFSVYSKDLGFRYVDGRCVNDQGEEGLNPYRIGQCGDFTSAVLNKVDLSEYDLRGSSFEGADLSLTILESAKLEGANFKTAILKGTSFAGADLKKTLFSYSEITNGDFFEANLLGSMFEQARIKDSVFDLADLSDVIFSATKLSTSSFVETKIIKTVFEDVEGSDLVFENARIEEVLFESAQFRQVIFKDSKIKKSVFRNGEYDKVEFDQSELSRSQFDKVKFRFSKFEKVRFVDFFEDQGSRYFRTVFDQPVFDKAVFNGSDFRVAEFSETKFKGVNLETSLMGNFTKTDLTENERKSLGIVYRKKNKVALIYNRERVLKRYNTNFYRHEILDYALDELKKRGIEVVQFDRLPEKNLADQEVFVYVLPIGLHYFDESDLSKEKVDALRGQLNDGQHLIMMAGKPQLYVDFFSALLGMPTKFEHSYLNLLPFPVIGSDFEGSIVEGFDIARFYREPFFVNGPNGEACVLEVGNPFGDRSYGTFLLKKGFELNCTPVGQLQFKKGSALWMGVELGLYSELGNFSREGASYLADMFYHLFESLSVQN